LFVQQPYLCLRLFSSSFRLRYLILLFCIASLFFGTEVLEIATHSFCIPPDTLEIGLQQGNSPSNIAFLGGDTVLFLFNPLQLVSLIRQSSTEVINFPEVEVELVSAVVVR
jgi:hypothetical protein